MRHGLPSANEVLQEIEFGPPVKRLVFDTKGLTDWDSGLLTFLIKIARQTAQRKIAVVASNLPEGAQRLYKLATAVPEKTDTHKASARMSVVARIGVAGVDFTRGTGETVAFLGEAALAFLRLLRGKAHFRRSDLWLTIQECGPQALPIVTLVSVLVGLIIAYMGAVQLEQFGAGIFVANLVGLGMARELGPMMTGILVAGRTGAAFAAQLGTMQVNEEIDAFKTLGITPMEFLVLPRMLALMLMMPLLTLYADLMGILGGAIVGVTMLDLGVVEYYEQTRNSLNLRHFSTGLFKSVVFGIVVAIAGCLRGIQSGRSASAVGQAATSAVVTSIVFIIVSSSILTIIYQQLGI